MTSFNYRLVRGGVLYSTPHQPRIPLIDPTHPRDDHLEHLDGSIGLLQGARAEQSYARVNCMVFIDY